VRGKLLKFTVLAYIRNQACSPVAASEIETGLGDLGILIRATPFGVVGRSVAVEGRNAASGGGVAGGGTVSASRGGAVEGRSS